MERKLDEEICLFVRDENTGRFLFNARALQALGINLVEAQQRGYPMKEQSALAEAAKDLTADQLTHIGSVAHVTDFIRRSGLCFASWFAGQTFIASS